MLIILFIILSIRSNSIAQNICVDYKYFGIKIYPTKCIDTIVEKITQGKYKNKIIKLFLTDCRGACSFQITDTKGGGLLLTGLYNNSPDTLKSMRYYKIMGYPKKDYVYKYIISSRFEPLESGIWNQYSDSGTIVSSIEYKPVSAL